MHGLQIVVDQQLAGAKRAIKQGGKLHVSPAMGGLLSHAEGVERERLLNAIPYTEIPESDADALTFAMVYEMVSAGEGPA